MNKHRAYAEMGKKMSYVKEYDWMASELGLKSGIRNFYALIYSFTQAGKDCFFSYKGFMEKLKIRSRTTISNYIQFLTERKLITVERTAGECNHYKANLNILSELRAGKTANYFQQGVQFLCEGSPVLVQYSNNYDFFYDDDSISLVLSETEPKEKEKEKDVIDFIVEKEKIAKQIDAASLQGKFDAALITNIINWIAEINLAESGYIHVNQQNVDVAYAKNAYAKLNAACIENVLSTIAKQKNKISCEKSYYLAVLYNAANADFSPKTEKKHISHKKKKANQSEQEHVKIDVKAKLHQAGVYALAEDIRFQRREFDKYDELLLDEIRTVLDWAWTIEKKTIFVNSIRMETKKLQLQFDKLRKWHILYVMDGIRNTEKEIKNRRAYLLTALYNATITYSTSDFNVNEAYPLVQVMDKDEVIEEVEVAETENLWTSCPQVTDEKITEQSSETKEVVEDTILSEVFSYVLHHGKTLVTTIFEKFGITEKRLQMIAASGFFDLNSSYITLHKHKERTFAV